jgi:hypothetical protein
MAQCSMVPSTSRTATQRATVQSPNLTVVMTGQLTGAATHTYLMAGPM